MVRRTGSTDEPWATAGELGWWGGRGPRVNRGLRRMNWGGEASGVHG